MRQLSLWSDAEIKHETACGRMKHENTEKKMYKIFKVLKNRFWLIFFNEPFRIVHCLARRVESKRQSRIKIHVPDGMKWKKTRTAEDRVEIFFS